MIHRDWPSTGNMIHGSAAEFNVLVFLAHFSSCHQVSFIPIRQFWCNEQISKIHDQKHWVLARLEFMNYLVTSKRRLVQLEFIFWVKLKTFNRSELNIVEVSREMVIILKLLQIESVNSHFDFYSCVSKLKYMFFFVFLSFWLRNILATILMELPFHQTAAVLWVLCH